MLCTVSFPPFFGFGIWWPPILHKKIIPKNGRKRQYEANSTFLPIFIFTASECCNSRKSGHAIRSKKTRKKGWEIRSKKNIRKRVGRSACWFRGVSWVWRRRVRRRRGGRGARQWASLQYGSVWRQPPGRGGLYRKDGREAEGGLVPSQRYDKTENVSEEMLPSYLSFIILNSFPTTKKDINPPRPPQ